ncbi:glycoside hydrolase family 3 protein [Francisella philomiragia]|uniref:glycoside hydrolase family 3 protein n=1 Tax=Francisella philomiragia TaxID=28110 RepID=UPI003514A581
MLKFSVLFNFIMITYGFSVPTLEEQVGQMIMVGFYGTVISDKSPIVYEIKNYKIGGVILLDHEKGNIRNIENSNQLKKLTKSLQKYTKDNGLLPLFISIDQEGGLISNLKEEKGFYLLSNMSEKQLGELKDNVLAETQAYEQGQLMKSLGINLDFSPVVDLDINPNNPAIGLLGRSFGRDASLVVGMAQSQINGYHSANIMCTLKHFPGLGSASANTDFSDADVTSSWSSKELVPYKHLINMDHPCQFIMVTHLINKKLDKTEELASLSKTIVTDLLRKKLNFQGLIITDNLDAKAITNRYSISDAVRKAILAGNDIVLIAGTQGNNPYLDAEIAFNTILNLAKKCKSTRHHVLSSYLKIRAVKEKYFKNNI